MSLRDKLIDRPSEQPAYHAIASKGGRRLTWVVMFEVSVEEDEHGNVMPHKVREFAAHPFNQRNWLADYPELATWRSKMNEPLKAAMGVSSQREVNMNAVLSGVVPHPLLFATLPAHIQADMERYFLKADASPATTLQKPLLMKKPEG